MAGRVAAGIERVDIIMQRLARTGKLLRDHVRAVIAFIHTGGHQVLSRPRQGIGKRLTAAALEDAGRGVVIGAPAAVIIVCIGLVGRFTGHVRKVAAGVEGTIIGDHGEANIVFVAFAGVFDE